MGAGRVISFLTGPEKNLKRNKSNSYFIIFVKPLSGRELSGEDMALDIIKIEPTKVTPGVLFLVV